MLDIILFCIFSLPLLLISRRSMNRLGNHGLYRFFVWECILWTAIQNRRHLIVERFDAQQLASSALMLFSLLLVISAVLLLRKAGRPDSQRQDRTLLPFEKTTKLIETGIFGYIRHPMYSSLLFFQWGLLLRNVTAPLLGVTLIGTLLCAVAARIEEKENLAYFGAAYRDYMKRTKRFIPYVI